MTDKRRRRSRAETLAIVGAVSGAAFIGVFGGLANQMAASKDPVLGPKSRALQAQASQPVQRTIIKRTIVVRKIHDPAPSVAAAGAPARASAGVSAPAPVVVQAGPAPAPAPASAPAPVVTKAS